VGCGWRAGEAHVPVGSTRAALSPGARRRWPRAPASLAEMMEAVPGPPIQLVRRRPGLREGARGGDVRVSGGGGRGVRERRRALAAAGGPAGAPAQLAPPRTAAREQQAVELEEAAGLRGGQQQRQGREQQQRRCVCAPAALARAPRGGGGAGRHAWRVQRSRRCKR
jgi:hypothetical protein